MHLLRAEVFWLGELQVEGAHLWDNLELYLRGDAVPLFAERTQQAWVQTQVIEGARRSHESRLSVAAAVPGLPSESLSNNKMRTVGDKMLCAMLSGQGLLSDEVSVPAACRGSQQRASVHNDSPSNKLILPLSARRILSL